MSNFFSYELPSIFSKLPKRLLPYVQLSRPYHFAGGVIPSLIGLSFIHNVDSMLKWYVLFAIGSFAILGAGATINDIIDEKVDVSYHRSMSRPITSGRIHILDAILHFFIQLVIAFIVWLQMPETIKLITLINVFFVCIYPFMKRFLYVTQVYLGLITAAPCLISYYMFEHNINIGIICLWIALSIHCMIFDTFFEYSEYFHNQNIKAKSLALLIGAKPKNFLASSSFLALVILVYAGIECSLSRYYFASVLLAECSTLIIIRKVNLTDQEQCLKSFLAIQMSNVVIFIGSALGAYIK